MVPLSVFFFGLFFVLGRPSTLESSPIEELPDMSYNNTNPLTSHVLDTASGRPAEAVKVVLYKKEDDVWRRVSESFTNADGRVGNIISPPEFTPGIYKLYFDTLSYYQNRGEKTFYPYIEIIFEIELPEEHYHVPILLSAYGFSTYRGS